MSNNSGDTSLGDSETMNHSYHKIIPERCIMASMGP